MIFKRIMFAVGLSDWFGWINEMDVKMESDDKKKRVHVFDGEAMGSKKIVFECHDLRYQNVILPNKERVSYKRPESSSPFIVNIENLTFHNKFLTEDKDVEIGRAMSASEFMKNEAINEPTSE